MGAATKTQRRRAHADAAREKAEQLRAAARRRRRRRRQVMVVVGASVGVLAIVGLIVGAAAMRGSPSPGTGAARTSASQHVLDAVTGVPATTIDAVGRGSAAMPPSAVHDAALTADGKPLVLYIGAEYCPFCAAERWALVQALSRFGTWHDLSLSHSAVHDVHPRTPTFSFHGATYTSDYLAFTGKELFTNRAVGSSYEPLDRLTDAEQRLFYAHTNAFPFTDLGGRYVMTRVSFEPSVLDGLGAEAIARALRDPESPVTAGVLGAANVTTAALCRVTGGAPANVCTVPGVTAAATMLRR